jgi:hypothetical protein
MQFIQANRKRLGTPIPCAICGDPFNPLGNTRTPQKICGKNLCQTEKNRRNCEKRRVRIRGEARS